MSESKRRICTRCGTVGHPVASIKGSVFIEIALWLVFLLPGFIYSIWRHTTKAMACPACDGTALIPLNSPIGRVMLKEQSTAKRADIAEAVAAEPMPASPIIHDKQFTVAGIIFEVVTQSAIDDKEAYEIVMQYCRDNKLDPGMAGSVQRIDTTQPGASHHE